LSSRGKQYEQKVKENWYKTFPKGFLYRVPDQVTGYKFTSSNVSDFIGFNNGKLFLLECKSHNGNTFPFANLTQYDKLLSYFGIDGVRIGVLLWMVEHGVELYIPVSTIKRMKEDGLKSFNVKYIGNSEYRFFVFPSKKRRVFLDSDYSLLSDLKDGD
jgi:penicillin-binding protein-related factor A (putative recombinase)